ncbi:SDR family NAD(P)-dependent oxidoreductase [Streptomyces sp. NPDC012623]|uniref:SDR family NAD(P)-dependent oxidoreductase n=1 Tax=unclassified Streptomyces TaxID=2593676 RepID=UPI0036CECC72
MATTLLTGANKGLGFETARRLVAAGHTVYVGSRDAERGRRAAEWPGARAVVLDITDDASVAPAENAGHDGLRAWVCSTRSKVALWDGRLRDAVTHARRGARLRGRHGRGAAGVSGGGRLVRAGGGRGSRSCPREGRARSEASTGEDDIGGLFSCPQARQENYVSAVRLRIGQPHDALRATETALGLLATQPVRAHGTEAQIHIAQARALLDCGEPEGVMPALMPVLAMPAERRMGAVTQRMRELAASLAHGQTATASATTAAGRSITEWCADSAPRHLALSSGEGAG